MFAARRIPLTAMTLLAPLAVLACGESPKPTTTTVSGARTPEIRSTPVPSVGTPAVQPVSVTYADGEAAYRGGRYADAARTFAAYSERHPANVTAHYMAGLSAWKAGDLKAADSAFDRALAVDSAHVPSLVNSSRVLLDLGRTDEAIDRLNTVIGIDSASGVARRLLGRALEARGDIEGAIDAYHQALLVDERDVWSLNNLGLLYIQQGRAEDALGPLARAVDLKANAPVFQNNLGIALEQTRHYGEAAEAFEAALAADSTYAKASVNLARVRDRVDATGTGPIDLKAQAQAFQLEIRMLQDSARTVSADSTEGTSTTVPTPEVKVNEPQH